MDYVRTIIRSEKRNRGNCISRWLCRRDALGGLFNWKKVDLVDLKVDLSLKTTSTTTLTGEKTSQGWSDVSLPVPGNTNIPTNQPIYNQPLGVWNLNKTPVITITPWQHDLLTEPYNKPYSRVYKSYHYLTYLLNIGTGDLMINPVIKDLFNVQNFKAVILEPEEENNQIFHSQDKGTPYG